jgi:predicted HAD superfamily phosphohydrolase YqeG
MQDKILFNMSKFQVSNMFKLNKPQHQAFQQFTTNINYQDHNKNMIIYVGDATITRQTQMIKIVKEYFNQMGSNLH